MSALHKGSAKFIVGRTSSICHTFQTHNANAKCEFSAKYAPWVILDLRESQKIEHFELANRILYTMKLFGVDNVRGGPWMKDELCPIEAKVLRDIVSSERRKLS